MLGNDASGNPVGGGVEVAPMGGGEFAQPPLPCCVIVSEHATGEADGVGGIGWLGALGP